MSKIDKLVEELSESLEPVEKLSHPMHRAVHFIALSTLYVFAISIFSGFSPDLTELASNKELLFEVILMLALFISGAFATSWLCVPDMRGQSWIVAIPLTLLSIFSVWIGIEIYVNGFELPDHIHMHHCAMDAGFVTSVPAAVIVFMSLKGASTRPVLSSVMGMLTVTALGYVALRFSCMMATFGHIAVYHIFPFVIGGAILGAVAQHLYRRW